MAGGTVAVRFVADISNLTSGIGKAESKLASVGRKMQGIGTKMSLGISAPLALLGVTAGNATRDLAESLSKSNTIFDESGKKVEQWAEGAAQAFGQSKRQALDAAGTFGNIFRQLGVGAEEAAGMSMKMTELASDFASFHNADITQVIEAQTSAFRGEYDALQRFVPTINAATVEQKALAMTGKTTTKELTAQEKALAVQTLMFEGAGEAAGDFARTSDGVANSQRKATAEAENASSELGEGLQPVMKKVTEVTTTLSKKFSNLSDGWQNAIVIGGLLLFTLGPLVGAIGAVVTVVGALSGALTFLAANPVVLIIAAIVALGVGLVVAYKKCETFRNIVDAAFRVVVSGAEFMRDMVIGAIRFMVDKWLAAAEWIVKGAAAAFGWVPGIGGKLKAAARAVEEFRDDVNGALGGIGDKEVKVNVKLINDLPEDQRNAVIGAMIAQRAAGGPVKGGTPYLVGEKGPELFVPSSSGGIVPNHKLGGAAAGVVVNVAQTNADPYEIGRELLWTLRVAG
jgi:hypothetical protein